MKGAVKLIPAFKDYLWGGDKLKRLYNKNSDMDIVAESWELSAHKDGESKVLGYNCTLSEYIQKIGTDCLGTNAQKFGYFPILIKFIDAKKDLSVQVHPDDDFALKNEGEYGKTEMWYILECDSGAFLYYGFNKDVTETEYKSAVQNGTLTDILNKVTVKKGDVFFIPAGTVHAIGSGMVICEIQQNSNTTYRVYDYNRRDKDGNLRPLHVDKALKVSRLEKSPELPVIPDGDNVTLSDNEYFKVQRIRTDTQKKIPISRKSFHSVTVTDGSGVISFGQKITEFTKGDSIFIPAQEGEYTVSGKCELIITTV